MTRVSSTAESSYSEQTHAHQHLHRDQSQYKTYATVDDGLQEPVRSLLSGQQLQQFAAMVGGPIFEKVVHQPRQLRQQLGVARRLGAQLLPQLARADLVAHPFLEERPGGVPQVQLRVELAAQPLDVEQRLLQQ